MCQTFENTAENVRAWARERGIDQADPAKQTLKLMEETGRS